MARRNTASLSPDVTSVGNRIEEWRQTRQKRTRMPEELWRAAVAVAREHGAWAVSRALRVRYDTLKIRLMELNTEPESADQPRFVELGPAVPSTPTATTVELSRVDGARLTMRFDSNGGIDVQSLMDAFCRAAR